MSWVAVGVGVGSTVIGGLVGKQKAPKAAAFKPVDVQAEQRRALSGNLDSADEIEQLVARSNAFTQDQASGLMERAVPGYSRLSGRFTDQANKLLDDPYSLPQDVSTNLTRLAGERGISTGVRGQANDYSLLRDFGVNSLQYGNSRISQAQSILQTIAGLAPRVNPMSPMSFYVTPGQQIATQDANNRTQFGAQQAQNNANAAADNTNSSMWGNIIAAVGPLVGGAAGEAIGKIAGGSKSSASSYDDMAAAMKSV